jgi:hypothetical protein
VVEPLGGKDRRPQPRQLGRIRRGRAEQRLLAVARPVVAALDDRRIVGGERSRGREDQRRRDDG